MRWMICWVALCGVTVSLMAKPKIAWLSNLREDMNLKGASEFWERSYMFAVAAAEDLDLDFKVYFGRKNFVLMQKQAKDVLSNPNTRPDAIMFHNYKNIGASILALAEKHGVKVIVFNAGMGREKFGLPRERFKTWIGELLPDDEYAGQLLAEKLIQAARKSVKRTANGKIGLVALGGNKTSGASMARLNGLSKVLRRSKQVEKLQTISFDWSRRKAKKGVGTIVGRYPGVSIFWSASDSMAFGVNEGVQPFGLVPGKDYVIGGIDLVPESILEIQKGRMAVSIGGHYIDSVWALILLYDYLNGHDFASEGSVVLKTQMMAVSAENLFQYRNLGKKLTLKSIQAVDFRKFSKTHNRKLKKYNFNASQLLKQL